MARTSMTILICFISNHYSLVLGKPTAALKVNDLAYRSVLVNFFAVLRPVCLGH